MAPYHLLALSIHLLVQSVPLPPKVQMVRSGQSDLMAPLDPDPLSGRFLMALSALSVQWVQ